MRRAAGSAPSAPLLAALITFGVVALLVWPLPLRLADHHVPALFASTHAWVSVHALDPLFTGEPWGTTRAVGFPASRIARFIGWVPSVAASGIAWITGPLAAFNLVLLASLPASAAAAAALARRWTDGSVAACVAAGCLFALCPYLLGTVQIGEVPKLQAWIVPLVLLVVDRALDGRRVETALVALLSVASAFTCPYYALALPLLVAPQAALRVRSGTARPGRALLVVALLLAGLLPAWPYYSGERVPVEQSIFRPSMRSGDPMVLIRTGAAASLDGLFVPRAAPPEDPARDGVVPIAYLGLVPVLVATGMLLRRRPLPRGALPGVALLAVGALLAMGPQLSIVGNALPVPLPAALLEAVGHPWRRGGAYFRLVIIANLGLAVLLASAASRWRRPTLGAGLVVTLALLDATRATWPWPLTTLPVPHAETWAAAAGDDGAVLHLPIGAPDRVERQRLLVAVLHGRPSTALTRHRTPAELHSAERWIAAVLDGPDPAATLRSQGFRHLACDGYVAPQLIETLGSPLLQQPDLTLWDLAASEGR